MADDGFFDVLDRLAAALQSERGLRLEIGVGGHQQVLLPAALGDREAMAGEIEQRDVGAAGRLGEFIDGLFEPVERDVLLHRDGKADLLQARRDQVGVDRGVGERRGVIGAVGDDERDAAAGGRRRGGGRGRGA